MKLRWMIGLLLMTIGAPRAFAAPIDDLIAAAKKEGAVEFLEIFLGPVGQAALRGVHITPLIPAETNDLTKVPELLRPMLKQVP